MIDTENEYPKWISKELIEKMKQVTNASDREAVELIVRIWQLVDVSGILRNAA
jgi:hypothetical protein